ncbi:MAG: DUF1289 domain-containing protein [Lysobacteraceae bacterium]
MKAILSPCIGVCTLDARGQCTGCFRSTEEIANWLRYSDAQRARFIDEVLPAREEGALRRSADSISLPTITLDIVG